jgi:hypothetical protein
MKLNLLIIANLIFFCAFAGKETNSVGARSAGVANSSLLFNDFWSAENNPAGLGFLNSWGGGISYENHFLIKELSYKSMVIGYPTGKGAFGLTVGQLGYNLYQENKIGFSYGQRLSETFSMGIQLNYMNTRISEGYGTKSGLTANIGLIADLSEKIRVAAMVINPGRTKLSDIEDERIPALIKLGFGYKFSKKVSFLSEIEKDIDFDSNAKFGIEYKATELLFFRVGYGTHPSISTFGFGLKLKEFTIDASSSFHSKIGFSPQISISYCPIKKKRNDLEKEL